MGADRPATYWPVFIGGLIGAAVGLCLFIYAFLATFGNPFATFIAEVLFPFALSVSRLTCWSGRSWRGLSVWSGLYRTP